MAETPKVQGWSSGEIEIFPESIIQEQKQTPPSITITQTAILSAAEFDQKVDEIIKSLDSLPQEKGFAMYRVINLIRELLKTFQELAIIQADSMDLPTGMQGFYTNLIAKAPVYTKYQPENPNQPFIDDVNDRADANNKVGAWVEQLKAWRDQHTNINKRIQAELNTTNEAVNQQLDTLNTLMQQLRELVSLITR